MIRYFHFNLNYHHYTDAVIVVFVNNRNDSNDTFFVFKCLRCTFIRINILYFIYHLVTAIDLFSHLFLYFINFYFILFITYCLSHFYNFFSIIISTFFLLLDFRIIPHELSHSAR